MHAKLHVAAYLFLHGAEAKAPAELVSQVDHECVYPLGLSRVGDSCDDGELTGHNLHQPTGSCKSVRAEACTHKHAHKHAHTSTHAQACFAP